MTPVRFSVILGMVFITPSNPMNSVPSGPGLLAVATFLIALGTASAETRQWTNAEGKSITGELKSVTGDTATLLVGGRTFDIPVSSLSAADQTYIKEWQAAASGTSVDPAKAYDTPVMKALESGLVKLDGGKLDAFTLANPEKIEVVAFYSSASWCGPCHAFTPELARAYGRLKKKYDNFELFLLSADNDRPSWEGYVKEYKMPFPAIDFDVASGKGALQAGRNSNFIPSIHILAGDGTVLDDASAGARASLENLEKILKEKASKKS